LKKGVHKQHFLPRQNSKFYSLPGKGKGQRSREGNKSIDYVRKVRKKKGSARRQKTAKEGGGVSLNNGNYKKITTPRDYSKLVIGGTRKKTKRRQRACGIRQLRSWGYPAEIRMVRVTNGGNAAEGIIKTWGVNASRLSGC